MANYLHSTSSNRDAQDEVRKRNILQRDEMRYPQMRGIYRELSLCRLYKEYKGETSTAARAGSRQGRDINVEAPLFLILDIR